VYEISREDWDWDTCWVGGILILLSPWPVSGLWMTSHYTLSCVHLLSLSTRCHGEQDLTHTTLPSLSLPLSLSFTVFFRTIKAGHKSNRALGSPFPIGKKKNQPDLTLSCGALPLIAPLFLSRLGSVWTND